MRVSVLILIFVVAAGRDGWSDDLSPPSRTTPGLRSGPITDAERAFWSFQTVRRPELPMVEDSRWCRTPIDRFVLAELESRGLRPTRDASPREFVRRATFDLLGLPPDHDLEPDLLASRSVDRFPDGMSSFLDRLLASRHYGERWGRHWLDVARYADTAGETADYPVPLAWRYRNWVIDAFNEDLPYDRFIQAQIAGDILAQEQPERFAELTIATGFLAVSRRFGFGIEEFQHLTIQDTIDTTAQSVLGLSVGCARCHDHKFDPISAEDYYAWYGIFESTKYALSGDEKSRKERQFVALVPGSRAAMIELERKTQREELSTEIKSLENQLSLLNEELTDAGQGPLSGDLENYPLGGQLLPPFDSRGASVSAEAQSPYSNVNPPGTRGLRTNNDAGNNGLGLKVGLLTAKTHPKLWLNLDIRNLHQNNPVTGSARIYVGPMPNQPSVFAAYIHGDAFWIRNGTRLEKVCDLQLGAWYNLQVAFDLEAKKFSGKIGTPKGSVTFEAKDFEPNWAGKIEVIFIDGHGWKFGVKPAQDIDNFTLRSRPLLAVDQTVKFDKATVERSARFQERATALEGKLVAKRTEFLELSGRGYELAYGVCEGDPADAAMQLRGDPKKPGRKVPRRHLEILGGQVIAAPDQSSGRLDLARWLSSAENPLTARVMVNRIWQHHFGRGLVETPNDFGSRGRKPSNPRLLDWLAAEFVAQGWSVKAMHRLIMSSRVYGLSSQTLGGLSAADEAERTRYFGRFSRRRLDAECIRDAMLAVSDRLDRSPGKSHPFPSPASWGFTQHAPFFALYPTNKRSVYLMAQRLKQHPFLELFDGPDPNSSTASRLQTTTPTQALYLLNDSFVHEQGRGLADRVLRSESDDDSRLILAYELALTRRPKLSEVNAARTFLKRYRKGLSDAQVPEREREREAWAALSRTILIRNEFLFID